MEWLVAVAIPVAGVVGGLIGTWVAKRSSRRSDVNVLLISQLSALYAEHPEERQAARDIIRSLMARGALSQEQLEAARIALSHWAAMSWGLPAERPA